MSTIENVHVYLGGGADTFAVDSVAPLAGGTFVHGDAGNDVITVGATATGLHPSLFETTGFIKGTLTISGDDGSDTVVFDNAGDLIGVTTGVLENSTVSGMFPGTVTFSSAETIDIELGGRPDTFYVPAVSEGLTVNLLTGNGFDTVYVGTKPGAESAGSLAGMAGSLVIDTQSPQTGDAIYFNDQSDSLGQTYTVSNEVTGYDGTNWPIDTTTVASSGMPESGSIVYRAAETVVLNAGSGNDTVNLQGTHREQARSGHSASFTVNGGLGNDTVNVGKPDGLGNFSLDSFAIDTTAATRDSVKGIPVVVNGQGGIDAVHFDDSASTQVTDLAFVQRTFAQLVPNDALPPTASPEEIARRAELLQQVYGDNRSSTSYTTVTLGHPGQAAPTPINISARDTEQVIVSLGSAADVVQFTNDRYDYDVTVYGGDGNDTFNIERGVDNHGHSMVLNGEGGDDLVFADFHKQDNYSGDGATKEFDYKASIVTPAEVQVYVAGVLQTFGTNYTLTNAGQPGGGKVKFLTAPVTGASVNVVFRDGIPTGKISLTFNGGVEDGSAGGDKLRIAGDGLATGGEYHPSASVARAGDITVAGNTFAFTGVEPLVVHGLPDFKTVTPDAAANLAIDSINVTDMHLTNLSLHVLTVDGVVSWTPESPKLLLESAIPEPTHAGEAIALSGSTLAVGTDLTQSPYGAVLIYNFTAGSWIEQGKLYPGDRMQSGGGGFAHSIALDGNIMVVGAPADDSLGTDSGAAYVFQRVGGSWQEVVKLKAKLGHAGALFGESVAVSGGLIVIGARQLDPGAKAGRRRGRIRRGRGNKSERNGRYHDARRAGGRRADCRHRRRSPGVHAQHGRNLVAHFQWQRRQADRLGCAIGRAFRRCRRHDFGTHRGRRARLECAAVGRGRLRRQRHEQAIRFHLAVRLRFRRQGLRQRGAPDLRRRLRPQHSCWGRWCDGHVEHGSRPGREGGAGRHHAGTHRPQAGAA